MRIAGLVAAVALAAARASLARAVAATRDADCRDWACARREMLAVIEEEFEDVGNLPGSSVRSMTQDLNGTYSVNAYAPGWLQCSTVDWGTFSGLDNPELKAIIGSLSLGELCDPQSGTHRDDATCKAFWASIRATIRLREEFQYGPRFWKYAAVRPDAHGKPEPTRETGADAAIALLSGQLARGRSWLGA